MIGDRLKKLRQQKKLTQTEFANKIGISRGTYAHYEINKRQPDYETLIKIASFFNVSTDFLLGVTDNPQRDETKEQKLKEFLEQPGVPYDETRYIPEEKLKPLRELLETVLAERIPQYKEEQRKKNGTNGE